MATSVVLARKLYVAGDARERALRGLEGMIEDHVGDLEATAAVSLRDDGFPTVSLEGDDATAARNVLAEAFGALPAAGSGGAPDEEAALAAGETATGTLERWDDSGLLLDAGQPIRVPAEAIGLGPGSPEQVVERFGLVQHLPMQFTVLPQGEASPEDPASGDPTSDGEPSREGEEATAEGDGGSRTADAAATTPDGAIPARLADAERDRLYDWQRGPGRVTVNSATRSEVRATVNRAGHARDVVTVERLGLLEHSIVCREGTDPPGLIASIGEYLPAELRAVV